MFRVSLDDKRMRKRAAVILAGLLGATLAGCGAGGTLSEPSSSGNLVDRMSATLFGPPAQPGDPVAPGTPGAGADLGCPVVDIRSGGSTLAIHQPRVEPTPMTLRFQATIARTARECAALGATMTIKVGTEGRIVVGPAGGPGQMEVPLRYTLVKEGPQPETIVSKFHRVPVSIPQGQGNVSFTHIEEDLTFPVPADRDLSAYVVYVGFDPEGLKERPVARRRGARK